MRVTREDAEAYYQTHAGQYPGKSFQDVQKDILSLLMDRKIDEELNQYIADLRSRADVRVNPA